MALPKRKHSKSRTNNRRMHWRITAPGMVRCPSCNKYKLPHRACPSCGHYSPSVSVAVKERTKKGRQQ
jgi:large subunit ribosomal protein L32